MDWPTAIMCGALGGCVIEAIAFYGNVSAWQAERRELLAGPREDRPLPTLRARIDIPADSLVFLTRLALGALAGALFHSQVIGMTAAVAVGASAPGLLRQLGATRLVQEAVREPEPAQETATMAQRQPPPAPEQTPTQAPAPDAPGVLLPPVPGEVPAE
ncbi:hypothetical protein ACFXPN_16755 [Streptomyces griseorubiginosus]|uniref:hypothetical protein n=1 Tax=Streptomyces griseorubiginosus TaxID=67304 RepID=UPI0036C6D8AD